MARAKNDPDASDGNFAMAWSPRPQARTLSLPEQIAHSVGNAIIGGEYAAGARVLEQELASHFQVSRGPVREALRILERDGLVQINARRGAQVAQLDADEVRQIFQVRSTLFGLATRLATERQDPELLAELKRGIPEIMALARDDSNPAVYMTTVNRMMLRLAAGCGNKYLRDMIFSLVHQTARYTRLGLFSRERRLQSSKNWKRLHDAVEKKNPAAAAAEAEALVTDSRDAALRLLRQDSAASAGPERPRKRAPADHRPPILGRRS